MPQHCPCGAPLRPIPHPAGSLPTWLTCPGCGRWWTAAGVELHRAPTERPDGAKNEEPLCPDRHGEE